MGTKRKPGAFDCYDAAAPDEPMFILLARDEQAPERVEDWAVKRFIRLADEHRATPVPEARLKQVLAKIGEAMECARAMRLWARHQHSYVDGNHLHECHG